jgi:arsenate reductase
MRVLLLSLAALLVAQVSYADVQREPIIVFVCDHGAAKSVVAASYFNKLAHERNISIRAVARGTEPQKELAPSAENGLREDRLLPPEPRPRALTPEEAAHATRVVTFLSLPKEYYSLATVEEWRDVPATGDSYVNARNAIIVHLKKLLDRLEMEAKNREAAEQGQLLSEKCQKEPKHRPLLL